MSIHFARTVPPPEGDPTRIKTGLTGAANGAVVRTRDRVNAAAALQRDADENRPQTEIERAGDYYFQKYQREKAAKKSREQEEFLKQCQQAERERVIADKIKFLVEECGFSPEQAAARAQEIDRMR